MLEWRPVVPDHHGAIVCSVARILFKDERAFFAQAVVLFVIDKREVGPVVSGEQAAIFLVREEVVSLAILFHRSKSMVGQAAKLMALLGGRWRV